MVPRWTADDDAFRFRAGRPSLDLGSTLLWRHVDPVEQLRQPGDLSRWLSEAGLWPRPVPATGDELGQARALREVLYRLASARSRGQPLARADTAVVNDIAAHPALVPQLAPNGRLRWHADEPVAAALSSVARDGIDLLTGSLAERIRECAAPDCAFLFVDTSRPGTRRWCAHNRCGNREHVRQHRARHTTRTTPGSDARPVSTPPSRSVEATS